MGREHASGVQHADQLVLAEPVHSSFSSVPSAWAQVSHSMAMWGGPVTQLQALGRDASQISILMQCMKRDAQRCGIR